MQDIGRRKILAIFLDTFFDGCKRIVCAAFHLYGGNVMSGSDNLLLDKEIYLHAVLRLFLVVVDIEKQFTSSGLKHLSNNIFHQHPLVDFQLVKHEFLVDFISDDTTGAECKGY